MTTPADFRWELDTERPQLTLFNEIPVRKVGRGAYRGLEFLEVKAKTIINEIPAGPLPFRFTVNAYRGCSHACVYCFARPTHEYLGFNIGTDFDTKIVVKKNAVELLTAETDPLRWAGDAIAMGTNTDPYQAAEGKYRITRGLIEVLAERANRFSVLTKSPLALRDLDLISHAASRAPGVRIDFSIGTLDEAAWRATEPGTAHPIKRMDAVARFNETGIPSAVVMGPVLPGISDAREQIKEVVTAAIEAGAAGVFAIPLHLKPGVREHYLSWLEAERPDLLPLHESRYEGRAYPPRAIGAKLNATIRRLIEELAPANHPLRATPPSRRPQNKPKKVAASPTTQTAFDLR